MVVSRSPNPALAPFVETLWYSDGYQAPHHKERVLPCGRLQIVIDLAGGRGSISGIRSKSVVIHTAAIPPLIGAVLRLGARCFFPDPAISFYDRVVPLDLVWGARAAQLHESLREAATVEGKFQAFQRVLVETILGAGERQLLIHPAVEYALVEFQRHPQIVTVMRGAKEVGLSRRRFSQLFRDHVGITPKLFCRLHRFRFVVEQIALGKRVNWADVAQAGGYCDQAHLSREFVDFAGISPSTHLGAERPFLNHVRLYD